MQKCPACGAENPDGSKYCNECGGKTTLEPRTCPSCGKVSTSTGKFCTYCGESYEAAERYVERYVPESRTSQPQPTQIYTPPPQSPTIIHVEPSKHMSVGGFLVIVLIIIILFVVFLLFFAKSSSAGQVCGLVIIAPIAGSLMLAGWLKKREPVIE